MTASAKAVIQLICSRLLAGKRRNFCISNTFWWRLSSDALLMINVRTYCDDVAEIQANLLRYTSTAEQTK